MKCRFSPWVRKILWRRKRQPTPVFCLGNPMDRGAWRAAVHGVAMSQTGLRTKHTCMWCLHAGRLRRGVLTGLSTSQNNVEVALKMPNLEKKNTVFLE